MTPRKIIQDILQTEYNISYVDLLIIRRNNNNKYKSTSKRLLVYLHCGISGVCTRDTEFDSHSYKEKKKPTKLLAGYFFYILLTCPPPHFCSIGGMT